MGLGNLMCITPQFASDEAKLASLGEGEVVRGGPGKSSEHTCKPTKVTTTSKHDTGAPTDSPEESDRITLARLISILRDAYIVTMRSFGNKPGGLGGMVMGGNIDLPDATPPRTFKEPRSFVRSWSIRRPRKVVLHDFSKRGEPLSSNS